MTRTEDNRTTSDVLQLLTSEGLDGMGEAVRCLINIGMKIERQQYLGLSPYERSDNRRDSANGFKPKTVKTRLGELTFDIPQVRNGEFYPNSLERGVRSERALKLTLAEMYVQGVSIRNVAKITQELCGFEVSSTQVSRAAQELDPMLQQWRNRSLGSFPYLFLDARYEHVRSGGVVVSSAVLTAIGISEDGKRSVLGTSVAISEQEVHWREFLNSLQKRGLHGVKLIISDAHAGLQAARIAVFPSVPWQRCQFHLQQNAQSYVPKKDMKVKVAADIRDIFNAPEKEEAERRLKLFIDKYTKSAPRLAQWAEQNLTEGLTVFSFPSAHRVKIRTSNPLERLNREIKRRTSVASIFPNEASCLRLVSAVLMEISEEWETGAKYLKLCE